jgi:hypothetical protein
MDYRVKYVLCVAAATGLAMVLAFSLQYRVSEDAAVFLFGGPIFIYFGLARVFHAGEVFNIILMAVVFAGYLAILFAPLYYIFRSHRLLPIIAQVVFISLHFLIGLALVR